MLNSKWKVCRVQLKSGQHTRKVRNRYDFDGRSLLELVSKYRANPKARSKFLSHLRYMSNEYYSSMHEAFQPANSKQGNADTSVLGQGGDNIQTTKIPQAII